ncbi:hypothetical protein F8388_026160 [Cannabis sativa]|uniref:Uncharacterized protein n=1 Tax=Cannabis sativa TaxID=3483 RepID=A0A7J6GFN9_CANSA|nr:hypothetical protein F8388_026160 [Cannabis sativa]KAF4381781.1 hypothetical protein G4B88_002931 [Cannabis sativa]
MGNTNTSPLFRTFVNSLFPSWFDETKPTYSVPSATKRISEARGPYGAKSIRARDTPSVLSPGRLSTKTAVTLEPTALSVLPGMLIPEKKKSSAFTSSGFLQNLPFTNTAQLLILTLKNK